MASERTWAEVKAARLDLLEDEYEQIKEENQRLHKKIRELEDRLLICSSAFNDVAGKYSEACDGIRQLQAERERNQREWFTKGLHEGAKQMKGLHG